MRNLGILLLLATFLGLTASSIAKKSLTSDEPVHLLAGYNFWRETKQVIINPEHPPLVKILSAIPFVLATDVHLETLPGWEKKNQWTLADAFVFHEGIHTDELVFRSRSICMVFGLGVCLLVFLFSQSIWGTQGAFVSLFLSAFCPNFIAYAGLVHTDMAASFGTLLSAYLAWRYFNAPSRKNLFFFSFATGLSLCAKFSTILLVPLAFLVFVSANAARWKSSRKEVLLQSLGLILIPTLMVSWIYGYWFNGTPFIDGLFSVYRNHDPDYAYYLNGEFSKNGFYSYYFFATLFKTPLPTLLLWIVGFFSLKKLPLKLLPFLLLPPLVFVVAGMIARHNIGIRHVLPCFPFLMIMAGGVTRIPSRTLRLWVPGICLLWLLFENVRIYPHYLAYFNEWAGGPQGGIRFLDDSNIDWGQDLKNLKVACNRLGIRKLHLDYFGRESPKFRKIPYVPMTVFDMYFPMGDHAVSVQYLIRETLRPDLKNYRYDWLERYTPAERIGYSIYLYRFQPGEKTEFENGIQWIKKSEWLESGFKRLTDLAENNPRFSSGVLALAQAHYQFGDRAKSLTLVEQAIRLEPQNTELQNLRRSLFEENLR